MCEGEHLVFDPATSKCAVDPAALGPLSLSPTRAPSPYPTSSRFPTRAPSPYPTSSQFPTRSPTSEPTVNPTDAPSTQVPTVAPVVFGCGHLTPTRVKRQSKSSRYPAGAWTQPGKFQDRQYLFFCGQLVQGKWVAPAECMLTWNQKKAPRRSPSNFVPYYGLQCGDPPTSRPTEAPVTLSPTAPTLSPTTMSPTAFSCSSGATPMFASKRKNLYGWHTGVFKDRYFVHYCAFANSKNIAEDCVLQVAAIRSLLCARIAADAGSHSVRTRALDPQVAKLCAC